MNTRGPDILGEWLSKDLPLNENREMSQRELSAAIGESVGGMH